MSYLVVKFSRSRYVVILLREHDQSDRYLRISLLHGDKHLLGLLKTAAIIPVAVKNQQWSLHMIDIRNDISSRSVGQIVQHFKTGWKVIIADGGQK